MPKRKVITNQSTSTRDDGKVMTIGYENSRRLRLYGKSWYPMCDAAQCDNKAQEGTGRCVTHGARDILRTRYPETDQQKLCNHPNCPYKLVARDLFVDVDGRPTKLCPNCRMNGTTAGKNSTCDLVELKKESGGKCVDCGTTDLMTLQFDHILGKKKFQISESNSSNGKREEAKKCVLRCARCHSIKGFQEGYFVRTHGQHRKRYDENYEMVNQIKSQNPTCKQCGWKAIAAEQFVALHWDHLNPATKIQDISGMCQSGQSKEVIVQEIAKCQLLCANCHQIKSIQEKRDQAKRANDFTQQQKAKMGEPKSTNVSAS